MAIARYPSFVYDCPDAPALAGFYATLLGWEVQAQDDWVDIRPADGSACISFQAVPDYLPPQWPGQDVPQQLHLDVVVEDLDATEPQVLELGATKADHQPGTSRAPRSGCSSTPPGTRSACASADVVRLDCQSHDLTYVDTSLLMLESVAHWPRRLS